jgi:DNA polymerase-3 subunit delta'
MPFQDIIGQERAKQMLQNGLRNGKLSHAYLFSGPGGTGKRRMAQLLAKSIFCTVHTDDACGECIECRKVEHHNHPNIHVLEPDGSTIKIEQVRELQKEFSFRSAADQTKLYMIHQAERMTTQAANSLLKFLEEPQSKVVAILITDNGQAVLPTIQSRAQWIPFTPMAPKQMLQILTDEGQSTLLSRPAVHITSGLDAARELLQLNWFAELRNVVIQLAKECAGKSASASIMAQHKVIKTELADHMDILLDLFILWFKDMIHIQSGRKDQIIYTDQIEWLSKHAFSREVSSWVHCMEQAVETRKRLRFYVNPQLALEQFLSHI